MKQVTDSRSLVGISSFSTIIIFGKGMMLERVGEKMLTTCHFNMMIEKIQVPSRNTRKRVTSTLNFFFKMM